MIKLIVFLAVQFILFTSLAWPVMAQETPVSSSQDPPILTYTTYLPFVPKGKPVNSMTRLTLRPDDVPEGFSLLSEGIITDFTEALPFAPQEGYQRAYLNFSSLYSGPFFIGSSATFFNSPAGYLSFIKEMAMKRLKPDESLTMLPVPPWGDDRLAYQLVSTEQNPHYVLNLIFIRVKNTILLTATGGFFPFGSDISLTISLAEKTLKRMPPQD